MAVTSEGDSRDTLSDRPLGSPARAQRNPQHRPAGAWLRVARRHWLLTGLLVAGLALRVITQLAYRPALLYIDSPKYLIDGLQKYDPQGYRALLVAPLTWIGNLAVVAGFQHLLGLAMAVTIYVVLLRRGAPRWAAALAAAPVLLDAYQLQMEQTIMPDVLFEALIVAGLAILAWKPRPSLIAMEVAAFILGTSATVRQVGEALILPPLLYCVLSARGWRARLGAVALVTGCFAIPVLGYMAYSSLDLGNGFELSTQGNSVLYGRVAAAADCTTLTVSPAVRAACPTPATVQSLGIDGLVNDPSSPAYTASLPGGATHQYADQQLSYAVLEQQPLRVAVSIGQDAVKLFALTRDTSPGDTPIWRWQFQDYYPLYPVAITSDTATQMFANAGGGGGPVAVRPLAVFLRDYQLHGGWTPGPFLLVSLIAGVAGVATVRRRGDNSAALACLLVTGLGVTVLLGADLYEFSWRYQLAALVTLPAGGALAVAAIRNRRHRTPQAQLQAQAHLQPPAQPPVAWGPCPPTASDQTSGPSIPGSSTRTPGSG
jgi:hypothetical protein